MMCPRCLLERKKMSAVRVMRKAQKTKRPMSKVNRLCDWENRWDKKQILFLFSVVIITSLPQRTLGCTFCLLFLLVVQLVRTHFCILSFCQLSKAASSHFASLHIFALNKTHLWWPGSRERRRWGSKWLGGRGPRHFSFSLSRAPRAKNDAQSQ